MARDTDTSFFAPYSLHQFSPSDMNNQQNSMNFQMTTPTNTFSSIESSGSDQYVERSEFEVAEFFSFDDWASNEHESVGFDQSPQNFAYTENEMYAVGGTSNNQFVGDNNRSIKNGREKKERVAFRMRSEIDVVDDGYKWRKYGKKMVKNNPNPRNYYRCSIDGCPVKKRVERDREDRDFVITTYEGNHNHQSTT